jgi:FkbM family methyltransferase
MNFPINDQYWTSTLDFLEPVIRKADKIIAPVEFEEKLDNVIPYDCVDTENLEPFSWVIIHKGMIETLEYEFLEIILERYAPVFANEVFVVFTFLNNMSRLNNNDVHLKAFLESFRGMYDRLKPVKAFLKSFRSVYGRLKPGIEKQFVENFIYFNIKDVGLINRTEFEFNVRNMSQSVYLGNSTVLCRILTKYMCYVDSLDVSLTPHLCLDGYWESWITQAMIRVLRKGFYCLDIGANCGYYSLIMADIVSESGRIMAVEANPRLSSLLEQTLAVNGFTGNSQVLQKAVSDTGGQKVNLMIPKNGCLGGATICETIDSSGNNAVEVETVTVDELTQDWSRVDLIKIDAEGAEDTIWGGMQNTINKNKDIIIIMEFSNHRYRDAKGFLEDIQSAGFAIQHIDYDSRVKPLSIKDCLTKPPGGHWDLYLKRS